MLPAGCKERIAGLVGPRGYLDRPEDLLLLAESVGMTAAQRLVREINIAARLACISL